MKNKLWRGWENLCLRSPYRTTPFGPQGSICKEYCGDRVWEGAAKFRECVRLRAGFRWGSRVTTYSDSHKHHCLEKGQINALLKQLVVLGIIVDIHKIKLVDDG